MREPSVKGLPEAGSRNGVRRERSGTRPGGGIPAPEWARGAVVYCVYPRAFSLEGTFEAVRSRLGDIRELGADVLWIMPVHPTGVAGRKGRLGSPYAIRDYFAIDPELGSSADFQHLVRGAHDQGIRVIMDLVLNHAALDHPGMSTDWFRRDRLGRRTRRITSWSDVADWNFSSSGPREHLLRAVEHWVREFDIDGYRCDVAGMVPADFWATARARLLALKPDHFMLAEWDDPAMHRSAFHATYDWELYRAMVRASRGRLPATVLSTMLSRRHSDFPRGAEPFRFVENHDEPRAPRRFRNAAAGVSLFTALAGGLFLIYNGQEIGATRRPDLFDRDPIEWNTGSAAKAGKQLQQIVRLRSEFRSFGPPTPVGPGSSPWLTAYSRSDDTGRKLVVALNLSGRFLPVEGELREQVQAGMEMHVTAAGHGMEVPGGHSRRTLPPRSATLWTS